MIKNIIILISTLPKRRNHPVQKKTNKRETTNKKKQFLTKASFKQK
jgi:hypothetical protein